MKVSCPVCSQRIALDAENLAELRGNTDFNCPACGARIPLSKPSATAPDPPAEEEAAAEIEQIARSFDARYQIKRLLGRGGMGAVYEGFDTRLDRRVAIKILPQEAGGHHDALVRFEREAKAMAALDHPNIVHIHDYGQTPDGNPYFVMEFIDGMDVHKLRRSGQLDLPGALDLISQVCAALQYAHSRGIVHRDIKPGNILVTREGVAKVADFGLAKVLGTEDLPKHDVTLTLSGTALGTPDYMAPEQLEGGHVDHRADIYSLGIMLYDLLTGSPPRGAWPPPSQRVQIDIRLDEIVLRSLQHNPSSRYQAAAEVRADIDSVKSSTGGGPLPPGSHAEPLPSSRSIAPVTPAPNSALTPSRGNPRPSQAAPLPDAHEVAASARSLGTTMLILGLLAIAILGGLAFYMANRKPPETHTDSQNVSTRETHNTYHTRIVAPGTASAADMEAIEDIKPFQNGFLGITKDTFTWQDAQALAERCGAEIPGVDETDPFWLTLLEEVKRAFPNHADTALWVRQSGEARILKGASLSAPEADPQSKTRHRVLLHWLSTQTLEQSKSEGGNSNIAPIDSQSSENTSTPEQGNPIAAAANNSPGNWTFVRFDPAAEPESAFAVSKDDVLMCFKYQKGWYLMSSRIFPAMKFCIDFKHPKGASGGHGGHVVVGSPGPSDLTSSDWTQRVPFGFEFKLRSGACGQLELPRADYSAELPFGQIRDGRRVSRSRQKDPVADEWNKLEIECSADNSVVARLNGEVVNAVTKVESVEGRIILWPFDGVHFRNPTVTINGKIEKLDFTLTDSSVKTSSLSPPASSELLPWTNTDGKTIQAEFVRLDSESVIIRKDGKEFSIPLAKLSPDSRKQAGDCAVPPTPAELARKPAPPFSESLPGTIWVVRDSLGDGYYFEFAPDGVLNYEGERGLRPNGQWRQDGSTVSIEINDGAAKLTGTLSGRQIRGDAQSTTAGHWTWEAVPR